MINQTYLKYIILVSVSLWVFTGINAQPHPDPLPILLRSVPTTPAFAPMQANIISFVDYRAIEAAADVGPVQSVADYRHMDAATRATWQAALLRVQAGPASFVNLVETRIEQMPGLLGFGYFDVDAALTYGADPFTGTLLYSADGDFSPVQTAAALMRREYRPRMVATGGAWGLGGDGMTDVTNMAMGDPFGGDVGLASRVAVFDSHTVMNGFIWDLVFIAAEAHQGVGPAYGDDAPYITLTEALRSDDSALLQAVIVSPAAGRHQTPPTNAATLPAYQLAAIADYQRGDRQVHRWVLLYDNPLAAAQAAQAMPGLLTEFDQGWLDTLGFEIAAPVRYRADEGGHVVVLEVSAPAEIGSDSPYSPGVVFGFWVRAIQSGAFFPFAVSPNTD